MNKNGNGIRWLWGAYAMIVMALMAVTTAGVGYAVQDNRATGGNTDKIALMYEWLERVEKKLDVALAKK